MTYYHQQVISISRKYLPADRLCEQVIQARKYIDSKFADPIGLSEIAGAAYCSKYHFLRLFKQFYGRTPHQYLTEVRIARAKEFLGTGLSVADSCFLVGFESVSSFKSLFKRHTGYTPRAWQCRLKNPSTFSATPLRFFPYYLHPENSNNQDR
jgi:AraC-like DNA-binding protein